MYDPGLNNTLQPAAPDFGHRVLFHFQGYWKGVLCHLWYAIVLCDEVERRADVISVDERLGLR